MEIPGIHQGVPDLGTAETKKPWKLGLSGGLLCAKINANALANYLDLGSVAHLNIGSFLGELTVPNSHAFPEVHICCLEEVFGGVALCGLHVTPCIKAEPQTHAFHEFQEHAKTRQFSRSGRLCELPWLRASTFLFPRAVE